MKMRDVANIIEQNIDFDMSIKNNTFSITLEDKRKLSTLLSLPYFDNFTNIQNLILTNSGTIYNRGYSDLDQVFTDILNIKETCNLFLSSFREFYPNITTNSFSLKLKETNDLKVIASIMIKLDTILNQLFTQSGLESKYELSNFDQGSKWLDIIIENQKAFKCFAAIMLFVSNMANSVQDVRLKEEKIQKIKLEKKLSETKLKELEEKQASSLEVDKLIIESEIEDYVKNLVANYYDNSKDTELPLRIKRSINELIDLKIDDNKFRPTNLISYDNSNNEINNWGYIENSSKEKIEYKKS